jgi:hypothetical protein
MKDINTKKQNTIEIPRAGSPMKVLSFNERHVGASRKKISLKWLIMSHNPYVILIQETMVDGVKAILFFESW